MTVVEESVVIARLPQEAFEFVTALAKIPGRDASVR
ncbi:hypothetical protein EDD25_0426 [Cryobacterium psychrophilum]|nr:hypothetical protein EDD25_0426 [Cryobacterium psychrophilum]